MKKWIKKSFHRQLLFCFAVVALFPLLLFGVSLIQTMETKINSDYEKRVTEQAEQIDAGVLHLFKNFEETVESINANSKIVGQINEEDSWSKSKIYLQFYREVSGLREYAQVDLHDKTGKCIYTTAQGNAGTDLPVYWGILKAVEESEENLVLRRAEPNDKDILMYAAGKLLGKENTLEGYIVIGMRAENFEKLLAVLLLLFSVIPTFGFFEIMQDGGKGLVHMVMIYLLGRYLALYHNRSHNTGRLFLGLFLSIGFIFLADSSLTFVRGKLYTTFCRDCSIFIIFGSVMVLLLFRELNFHSRFINRAAGNVLAVYVLDGTVQTFLLKWIDFKPYAGSWFLVFLAIGYALAIMIIACLLNEVRKATIGRLEPWLMNVVNAVVMWGVNAVRGVVRRLLTYFIG